MSPSEESFVWRPSGVVHTRDGVCGRVGFGGDKPAVRVRPEGKVMIRENPSYIFRNIQCIPEKGLNRVVGGSTGTGLGSALGLHGAVQLVSGPRGNDVWIPACRQDHRDILAGEAEDKCLNILLA